MSNELTVSGRSPYVAARGRSPCSAAKTKAFTLVEMVVALTIMAILLSLAFPAMKALREQEDPKHITGLLDLSRHLKARAQSERRPYQLVFDHHAIYGLRYFYPYGEETTFQDFLVKQDEERERRKSEIKRMEVQRLQLAQEDLDRPDGTPAPLPNIDDEYFVRKIELPERVRVEVRRWGAVKWKPIEGAEIFRWVFQPTGLVDPAQLRFGEEGQWREFTFEVLTGDLATQRIYAQ